MKRGSIFYKTTFVKIQNDIDCIDSFEKTFRNYIVFFEYIFYSYKYSY
ncbi:hypothetical protein LEP1GSC161_0552 [Leptospira santarosai str. CBC1416]|uniref:Uncharacterized protein n=1 Tax=Leptospira santarosai str. CBC1416 TaxID=1193059 RepID=M6VM56_9LEPT|nr:hypothetical protein LEP1GSC161_0552 [Leptospira santarosai str. CBC1416]